MRSLFSYPAFILSLSICILVGCATIPTLNVNYKTIPRSNILEGREVYFAFFDKRLDKKIIGNGAKELYRDFSGNINFTVSKGRKGKSLVKIYDVDSLCKNVFAIYLENMGLTLLSEPKAGTPELVIKLYDFVLDLSGRSWIARIAYGAEFTQDGNVLVRKFKGEMEKYRVSGLTQAHQVMSETFTDTINQLDVKSLFSTIRE